jgi:dienelactone hydrolase
LNARAALAASDFVNANKIGFWGHSMAGNVVMRSLAAQPTIPAAVVWAGAGYTYTDLLTYRISDNSYRPPSVTTQRQQQRQRLRDTYGEFDPNHPFWKQVAVTDYLTDIKGAIEIHHAVDDDVVSVEYSRNLTKLLDATSVPHALFEYSSGGHNITGVAFGSAMQRTVAFFKKYLQ